MGRVFNDGYRLIWVDFLSFWLDGSSAKSKQSPGLGAQLETPPRFLSDDVSGDLSKRKMLPNSGQQGPNDHDRDFSE